MKRKRPEIHRSMMLLAWGAEIPAAFDPSETFQSLSLLLGATARMPFLEVVFPGHGLVSFFGPVFALAAILLLVYSVLTRRFDRWFALGYAVMVITYLGAELLSRTETWRQVAGALLKS